MNYILLISWWKYVIFLIFLVIELMLIAFLHKKVIPTEIPAKHDRLYVNWVNNLFPCLYLALDDFYFHSSWCGFYWFFLFAFPFVGKCSWRKGERQRAREWAAKNTRIVSAAYLLFTVSRCPCMGVQGRARESQRKRKKERWGRMRERQQERGRYSYPNYARWLQNSPRIYTDTHTNKTQLQRRWFIDFSLGYRFPPFICELHKVGVIRVAYKIGATEGYKNSQFPPQNRTL